MASCALWLGSFPDGGQRSAGQERRRRCLLPEPWLQQLLDEVGGDGFAKKALYTLSPTANLTAVSDQHGAAKVLGLMRVSSSGCVANGGLLTPWHKEATLQRSYYGQPRDDYELAVEGFSGRQQEEHVHFKLSRHQGSGGLAAVQWTHPLLMPYWAGSAACVALEGASVAEQLQAWGDDIDANSLPLLLLPWPLAFLVSKRKWSRLLLLAR